MISEKLVAEFDAALTGKPWHGTSVMEIVAQVDSKKAHLHYNGPHSMADILLHIIAWTEEVIERLKGKYAADPQIGDWPDPSPYEWDQLVKLFRERSEHLRKAIVKGDNDFFHLKVNDDRYPDLVEKDTYEDLIRGLITHNIYHSAQIALLNK